MAAAEVAAHAYLGSSLEAHCAAGNSTAVASADAEVVGYILSIGLGAAGASAVVEDIEGVAAVGGDGGELVGEDEGVGSAVAEDMMMKLLLRLKGT